MSEMCDQCFEKAMQAVTCRHPVKSNRQMGDSRRPRNVAPRATPKEPSPAWMSKMVAEMNDTELQSYALAFGLALTPEEVHIANQMGISQAQLIEQKRRDKAG